MTGQTFRKVCAAIVVPVALWLLVSSCGRDTDTCTIDCEDESVPGSWFRRQFEDTSCDICREQFFQVRLGTCGLGKNPSCRCMYFCESEWEFKY